MRRIIYSLALFVAIWTAGYLFFLAAMPNAHKSAPPEPPRSPTEGIVVFTGGGGARILAAMDLFSKTDGARMLISGVHPDTTREHLASLWTGDAELFECCVDLGLEARTTEGNALEASRWATERGLTRIVLVTSDYHMPRALLETKARLDGIEIVPYPTPSHWLNERGKPASIKAWRQLANEYNKYLAVRVKTLFLVRT